MSIQFSDITPCSSENRSYDGITKQCHVIRMDCDNCPIFKAYKYRWDGSRGGDSLNVVAADRACQVPTSVSKLIKLGVINEYADEQAVISVLNYNANKHIDRSGEYYSDEY